jgi:hypothetical protein
VLGADFPPGRVGRYFKRIASAPSSFGLERVMSSLSLDVAHLTGVVVAHMRPASHSAASSTSTAMEDGLLQPRSPTSTTTPSGGTSRKSASGGWNALTPEQQADYITNTKLQGGRRLDFRFAH